MKSKKNPGIWKKEKEKRRQIQERYTKDLEEIIEERTIELKNANAKLLVTNKELLNMNEELEAFTYISSHDLQEPLRKIHIFAGRILEKEYDILSEKGKTYFTLIQNAANRMQNLIDDLLTFSRLNSSERKFELVNLQPIFEEVLLILSDTIEEKKAVIEIKEMCEANVIVFQIRQLVYNLISNALKFSKSNVRPKISIKSCITTGSEAQSKKLMSKKIYCHISITDNGIGFEEKFYEQIFEVFQKLHGKNEYPGTGIGLATVKKIVDHHHGTIVVRSALNKGTTFDIYIPALN